MTLSSTRTTAPSSYHHHHDRKDQRGSYYSTYLSVLTISIPFQKLNNLRLEADAAIERAEASEAKNKKLEQQLLEKEQEITSLTHRLAVADEQLEKVETTLAAAKAENVDNVGSKTTSEGLQRKIQLLEEELDAAEKNAKDTVEK